MMPKTRVFLSYSHSDKGFANEIMNELKTLGIEVGLAPSSVESGHGYIDKLVRKQLDAASVVVPILSEEALASPWINFELGAAMSTGKPVVPILKNKQLKRYIPSALARKPIISTEGEDTALVVRRLVKSILNKN